MKNLISYNKGFAKFIAVMMTFMMSVGNASARIAFEDESALKVNSSGVTLDANNNTTGDINLQFGTNGSDPVISRPFGTDDLNISSNGTGDITLNSNQWSIAADGTTTGLSFGTLSNLSVNDYVNLTGLDVYALFGDLPSTCAVGDKAYVTATPGVLWHCNPVNFWSELDPTGHLHADGFISDNDVTLESNGSWVSDVTTTISAKNSNTGAGNVKVTADDNIQFFTGGLSTPLASFDSIGNVAFTLPTDAIFLAQVDGSGMAVATDEAIMGVDTETDYDVQTYLAAFNGGPGGATVNLEADDGVGIGTYQNLFGNNSGVTLPGSCFEGDTFYNVLNKELLVCDEFGTWQGSNLNTLLFQDGISTNSAFKIGGAEVASGHVILIDGDSGDTFQITINGDSTSAVPFNSDLATTAADIAQDITANLDQYYAVSDAENVLIYARDTSNAWNQDIIVNLTDGGGIAPAAEWENTRGGHDAGVTTIGGPKTTATGSIELLLGDGTDTFQVTIDGNTGNTVTFDTDLTTTASLLADDITLNIPGYSASSSGTVITITANAVGDAGNGSIYVFVTDDASGDFPNYSVTQMSGGFDSPLATFDTYGDSIFNVPDGSVFEIEAQGNDGGSAILGITSQEVELGIEGNSAFDAEMDFAAYNDGPGSATISMDADGGVWFGNYQNFFGYNEGTMPPGSCSQGETFYDVLYGDLLVCDAFSTWQFKDLNTLFFQDGISTNSDFKIGGAEVSSGHITLTGGDDADEYTVYIEGEPGSAVPFNSDLATTAADIAADITANIGGYHAVSDGDTILIYSNEAGNVYNVDITMDFLDVGGSALPSAEWKNMKGGSDNGNITIGGPKTLATGSIELLSGDGTDTYQVTIDGNTGSIITFNTNLDDTTADLSDDITQNIPGYSASSSGTVITITADVVGNAGNASISVDVVDDGSGAVPDTFITQMSGGFDSPLANFDTSGNIDFELPENAFFSLVNEGLNGSTFFGLGGESATFSIDTVSGEAVFDLEPGISDLEVSTEDGTSSIQMQGSEMEVGVNADNASGADIEIGAFNSGPGAAFVLLDAQDGTWISGYKNLFGYDEGVTLPGSCSQGDTFYNVQFAFVQVCDEFGVWQYANTSTLLFQDGISTDSDYTIGGAQVASGYVTLTDGDTGDTYEISINGNPGSGIPFNTNLTTTAQDIATDITLNIDGYYAVTDGETVLIYANDTDSIWNGNITLNMTDGGGAVPAADWENMRGGHGAGNTAIGGPKTAATGSIELQFGGGTDSFQVVIDGNTGTAITFDTSLTNTASLLADDITQNIPGYHAVSSGTVITITADAVGPDGNVPIDVFTTSDGSGDFPTYQIQQMNGGFENPLATFDPLGDTIFRLPESATFIAQVGESVGGIIGISSELALFGIDQDTGSDVLTHVAALNEGPGAANVLLEGSDGTLIGHYKNLFGHSEGTVLPGSCTEGETFYNVVDAELSVCDEFGVWQIPDFSTLLFQDGISTDSDFKIGGSEVAFGSITLTGGDTIDLYNVIVNGNPGSEIAFNTDLATTATDIANDITATIDGYHAVSDENTILIYANEPGDQYNGEVSILFADAGGSSVPSAEWENMRGGHNNGNTAIGGPKVAATGTIELTSGDGTDTYQVTIDGNTGSIITFNTNLDDTTADLSDDITQNIPGYSASSSGTVITITADVVGNAGNASISVDVVDDGLGVAPDYIANNMTGGFDSNAITVTSPDISGQSDIRINAENSTFLGSNKFDVLTIGDFSADFGADPGYYAPGFKNTSYVNIQGYPSGDTLPGSCTDGDYFELNDVAANNELYQCLSGSWEIQPTDFYMWSNYMVGTQDLFLGSLNQVNLIGSSGLNFFDNNTSIINIGDVSGAFGEPDDTVTNSTTFKAFNNYEAGYASSGTLPGSCNEFDRYALQANGPLGNEVTEIYQCGSSNDWNLVDSDLYLWSNTLISNDRFNIKTATWSINDDGTTTGLQFGDLSTNQYANLADHTSDIEANLPATCTTGDKLYATDTKTLYVCTSTNTWTAQTVTSSLSADGLQTSDDAVLYAKGNSVGDIVAGIVSENIGAGEANVGIVADDNILISASSGVAGIGAGDDLILQGGTTGVHVSSTGGEIQLQGPYLELNSSGGLSLNSSNWFIDTTGFTHGLNFDSSDYNIYHNLAFQAAGAVLPGTCAIGDKFYLTIGLGALYVCTALNTWTLQTTTATFGADGIISSDDLILHADGNSVGNVSTGILATNGGGGTADAYVVANDDVVLASWGSQSITIEQGFSTVENRLEINPSGEISLTPGTDQLFQVITTGSASGASFDTPTWDITAAGAGTGFTLLEADDLQIGGVSLEGSGGAAKIGVAGGYTNISGSSAEALFSSIDSALGGSGGGTKYEWLDIDGGVRNSAAIGTIAGGNAPVILFDEASASSVAYTFPVPADWDGSSDINVRVYYSGSSPDIGGGATDVSMTISYASKAIGEVVASGDFTTVGLPISSLSTTLDQIDSKSTAIPAAALSADDLVSIKLERNPVTDGWDGDISIHMIRIEYTAN